MRGTRAKLKARVLKKRLRREQESLRREQESLDLFWKRFARAIAPAYSRKLYTLILGPTPWPWLRRRK